MNIERLKKKTEEILKAYKEENISQQVNKEITSSQIASKIDHTNLNPNSSKEEIIKLCQQAITYNFASVCVLPAYVDLVKNKLDNSSINICSVVGFPLGANLTRNKISECKNLIELGANEIDFVQPIYNIDNNNWELTYQEFCQLRQATSSCLKVILECCLLSNYQKVLLSLLALEANIDYIKTSTGFSTFGAKEEDIKLIKYTVNNNAKIKASGGISNKEFAIKLIKAGANRIGASKGIEIVS